MKPIALVCSGLATMFAVQVAAAGHDESTQGDLSNSGMAPNNLTLSAGGNRIKGAFGAPDLDYVAVTVPAGHTLRAIRVGPGNLPGSTRSFIAVQFGAQMTVPPTTPDPAALHGYAHVDAGDGAEVLVALGTAPGAIGFTAPLPAGTYTFWIQDTSPASPGMGFDFDFQVAAPAAMQSHPVPDLPAWALVPGAALLAWLGMSRWTLRSAG